MSTKTELAEQSQREGVTTPPPPAYEASNTVLTVDHVAHEAPEEDDLTRAWPVSVEVDSAHVSLSQAEQDNTIRSPPPTHQPMQADGSKSSPQTLDATQSVVITPLPRLTETPAWIDCPYCNRQTKTLVTPEGSSAQCMSAALCCLCCGIITVCIPFLCHWFEDNHIQCSGCKKQVAVLPHDGPIKVFWPPPPSQTQAKEQAFNAGTPLAAPAEIPASKGQ